MSEPGGPPAQSSGAQPQIADWELNEISLPEALGITVHYAADDLAPPVDMERLRALVRRELPPEAVQQTCRLIATFRSWHAAWGQAVREEACRDKTGEGA